MARVKDSIDILKVPTTDYYGAHLITALSEKTLRNLVSKKKIPYFKLGRAVRFSVSKLNAWMEERAVPELKKSLNGGL
ncbi:MAG: helix-turn-helix domain-containing protein [Spirochaetales bacterium]|nr:helix-turn-helix domain-containing protein [Spirochaetales bacterium]